MLLKMIRFLNLYSGIKTRCKFSPPFLFSPYSSIQKEHLLTNVEPPFQDHNKPEKLSTLYVPSRYGADMYQISKPYIDLNDIEGNFDIIRQSCLLRDIVIDSKESIITLMKEWEYQKRAYQVKIDKCREYEAELSQLKTENKTSEYETVQKEHSEFVKCLKSEKEKLYELEDIVMPILQKIPNVVHKDTPIEQDCIEFCSELPKFDFVPLSHTEIARSTSTLEFSSVCPTAYFLSGKLAELEFSLLDFFSNAFNEMGYAPMSCMDFVKSFLLEANGLDPYSFDDCIPITSKNSKDQTQKLNVIGGASFESLCAYLTNMNINTLPLKYFSAGRRYDAKHRKVQSLDLFSVVQSSSVHCAILTDSNNDDILFDSFVADLLKCYQTLNVPFRVVDLCVQNLNVTESRRKQFELWSPFREHFVPVAHVSQRHDFVSKRLNITYGHEYTVKGHCRIIEGSAVKNPVLIGCIIENFQTSSKTFKVPDILRIF